MRSIKAGLLRMASEVAIKESPARVLFAALAKAAGMREDLFARTSYLEGLVGYSPGILLKDPGILADARSALATGQEDRLVDELRHTRGMSETDISRMLGSRDTGLFDALLSAASSVMSGPVRGLDAEDIAMALAAGVSPLTGGPLKYGRGKGIFYWLGENAPGKVSLGGIKRIVFLEAKNRTKDVVRCTRSEERGQVSLDAPIGTGEDVYTLADILQSDGDAGRASFIDLAAAIYQDPWVMGVIDSAVKANLGGPVQLAIWDAIRANPEFIKVTSNDIGVESRALAQEISKMTGAPYMGKSSDVSVGHIFRQKVWPAMKEAFEDSEVAARLLKNRHILEVIQDATKRVPKTQENIPAGFPDTSPPAENRAINLPKDTPLQQVRPSQVPAWLSRLRHDPDLRILRQLGLKKASADVISLIYGVLT